MGWVVNAKPRPPFTPEKETRYQLSRRLGGPHGRSEGMRKIGIRSPNHLARSVSLYQLRYPGPPLIQCSDENVALTHSGPGQAFRGTIRLRLPEFLEDWQMEVGRLSALRTDHPYPHEIFLVLISVTG